MKRLIDYSENEPASWFFFTLEVIAAVLGLTLGSFAVLLLLAA